MGFRVEVLGAEVSGLGVGFRAWGFDMWARIEVPLGSSRGVKTMLETYT